MTEPELSTFIPMQASPRCPSFHSHHHPRVCMAPHGWKQPILAARLHHPGIARRLSPQLGSGMMTIWQPPQNRARRLLIWQTSLVSQHRLLTI